MMQRSRILVEPGRLKTPGGRVGFRICQSDRLPIFLPSLPFISRFLSMLEGLVYLRETFARKRAIWDFRSLESASCIHRGISINVSPPQYARRKRMNG